MGRYIGAKRKIAKKFKDSVFCSDFNIKKSDKSTRKSNKKKTEYAKLLFSKEKIIYLYNIREEQLTNYVKFAAGREGNSENVLASVLESRLDNVVYRLGMGKSRGMCRQLVSHGYILVNNKTVNIAAYRVKVDDVISFNEKKLNTKNDIGKHLNESLNLYKWLEWDIQTKTGTILSVPSREDIPEFINIKDVLEIYAR
ncbi:MAG: 30S ribosomal protein S4 [Cytophagales bacterium]|nr:30S ribosomal protein S4 [Cytophagales bacterium]